MRQPSFGKHDLAQDLRAKAAASHKLDIRLQREDGQTAFEVIEGEPELVERCEIASKVAQLRIPSDLTRQLAHSLARGAA